MSPRAAFFGIVLLAGLAGAEPPVPLGTCGPVARSYDPIELPAERLGGLRGTPIVRVGLLAFRDGRLAPIPFQVDERRGRKLALPDGPEPTEDDRPGLLDDADLIVFMACDAGEQAKPAIVEETHPKAWREIRIEDPLDHTSAFAYLVVTDDPPLTTRRYVGYDPAGDLVSSTAYRVGMVNALPNYFSLVSKEGPGANLLDGLRLRAEATLIANLAHWTLNEQQGVHRLIAWKSGPVRVVRRSRHQVNIGLGIRLTAATAHSYFYPRMVFGPGSLKLPISPGILFRDITAFGGADFRDLRGWRYHAPGAPPEGFPIDGHMDDPERSYDAFGDWFVVEHGDQAIMMVTRMSENLQRGVRLRLIYADDPERDAPPEGTRGALPLVGYRGLGVERLAAGRYTFQLRIFILPGYRAGDEKRILAQLDAPLTADGGAGGP
jgi:hypothetical protein